MKIRTGFVSNSSSSSFVVLGFAVPRGSVDEETVAEKMDLVDECLEDYDVWFADSSDMGAPNGKTLVGIKIADISDESGPEEQEFDFVRICKDANELKYKCGIDPNIPLKLYTGSRSC